jgi:hypothetical protein
MSSFHPHAGPMAAVQAAALAETIDKVGGWPGVFEWAVRREIRADPRVLE